MIDSDVPALGAPGYKPPLLAARLASLKDMLTATTDQIENFIQQQSVDESKPIEDIFEHLAEQVAVLRSSIQLLSGNIENIPPDSVTAREWLDSIEARTQILQKATHQLTSELQVRI